MKITEEMKEQLMATGLKKQQINSSTAETVVEFFMNHDEKVLIQEAQRQVDEMRTIFNDIRMEYSKLKKEFETVAGTLLDIAKAQEEHGALTDEKARNALIFYAALLKMNEHAGAKGFDAVNNAGYVTSAYLGGQARRDIHYDRRRDDEEFTRRR